MSKEKSLKITRKKKRAKRAPRKRLTIKQAKLNRTLRKSRTMVKKAVKKAVKGMHLSKLPEKLFKRIDVAIAKNPALADIVNAAVVDAVNALPGKSKREKKVEEAAEAA